MTSHVFNIGGTVPGSHPHISSFAKLALPVTTALTGAYVFGGNPTLSLRNRANPNLPLLQVGSPTIDPLFGATVQHDNCFDTQLTPSTDRTWIVICKPQALTGSGAANKASLMGNQVFVGSNERGDQMWLGDPSQFYNQADINGTSPASVSQGVSSLDPTKWAALVGIVDTENGIMDCARRQGGVTTWVSPTRPISGRALYTARNIRIGGDGTGTPGIYAHSSVVGMDIIQEAVVSHSDVEENLDYISDWLNKYFGIADV